MPGSFLPPDTRVALDDLAPPRDNRRLNVTVQAHGLMPKLSGNANEIMNGQGEYVALSAILAAGTVISVADADFSIYDDGTPAKIAQFECAGLPNGTSTFSLPPLLAAGSDTLAALGLAQTFTGAQTFSGTSGITIIGAVNPLNITGDLSLAGWPVMYLTDSVGGGTITIYGESAAALTPVAIGIPNTVDGILLATDAVQTVTNKIFSTANRFLFNGGTANCYFQGSAGTNRRLTLSIQGTNSITSVLAIAPTAARTWTLPDVTSTVVTWAAGTAGFLPAAGDLLYGAGTATAMAKLTIGSSGTILTSSGSAPQWSTNAAVVDVARSWTTLQTFPDNTFKIVGSASANRTLVFEVDGASANADCVIAWVGTADRTITLPDATTTLAGLAIGQTFTKPQTMQADNSANVSLTVFGAASASGINAFACLTNAAANLLSANVDGYVSIGSGATLPLYLYSNSGAALDEFVRTTFSDTGNVLQFFAPLTGSRATTFPNDTGTLTTTVAPASATVDLTGKTASVGATTAYTTVHAGMYRISFYAVMTAVTLPGNLTVTGLWTDPQQAQTKAMNLLGSGALGGIAYAAAGDFFSGSIEVYATSGSNIQFSTTQTGTGTYRVHVRVEALS